MSKSTLSAPQLAHTRTTALPEQFVSATAVEAFYEACRRRPGFAPSDDAPRPFDACATPV